MTKVLAETTCDWWVMGDTDGNYICWEDDKSFGHYSLTRIPECADRFGSKEEAMLEITSTYVQNDLDWEGGEIVPLHVEKRMEVSVDR